jgi:hypothetical protein
MRSAGVLFSLDAWVIALILFAAMLIAAEVGHRLGRRGDQSSKLLTRDHVTAARTTN